MNTAFVAAFDGEVFNPRIARNAVFGFKGASMCATPGPDTSWYKSIRDKTRHNVTSRHVIVWPSFQHKPRNVSVRCPRPGGHVQALQTQCSARGFRVPQPQKNRKWFVISSMGATDEEVPFRYLLYCERLISKRPTHVGNGFYNDRSKKPAN